MIHEVKFNFPERISSFAIAHNDELKNKGADQTLNSIIAALSQHSENYCVVLNVVSGRSLEVDPTINVQLQELRKKLTKREFEILELAIKGLSNKNISEKLFITVETVKSHRKSIVNKAGVSRIDEIKNRLLNKKL